MVRKEHEDHIILWERPAFTEIVDGKERVNRDAYIHISHEDLQRILPKIKADKDDKMGWKKHKKVLKDHGYDIE